MCTAVSINASRHLFSRTLDLDTTYGEAVLSVPRRYPLNFRHENSMAEHNAILGVGCIFDEVPLYYDAFNDKGLAMAGLSFPNKAVYFEKRRGSVNIASFELITYVLARCSSIGEAAQLLENTTVTQDKFNSRLETTPLHWILADKSSALTVESTERGLEISENPFGVLTNSPEFSYHTTRISDFMQVDSSFPENKICSNVSLPYYSKGLGACGLPGDFSSSSRFMRAVFLKNRLNADATVSDAFHLMDNISVPRGAVMTENKKPFYTIYTSVADINEGVYYFTTADSRRIRAVQLDEKLKSSVEISVFSMTEKEKVYNLN